MTWGIAGVLAAIIGVPLMVLGIALTAREQTRRQAQARADERQKTYNDGFKAGQEQAAPGIALMRSQRDDARRDRDQALRDVERLQTRCDQLEDELRRHP